MAVFLKCLSMRLRQLKNTLMLLIMMALSTNGMAQVPVVAEELQSLKPQLNNPRQSKVPVWLNFSMGANFSECFDKGTVPFRYNGFGANANAGVTVEWGRNHIEGGLRGFYTSLSKLGGTAMDVKGSVEYLYRCCDYADDRLHLWAGGALQGFVDFKNIPALMNASSCVSLFGNLCATGMVQYDFAFLHDGSYNLHNLLTAYGKLSLPLVGAVNRPGYAYIGNPTINDDVWLGGNETFAKFLPGASTELGLYLNLRNGNRLGLSYSWDYLTTGMKDTHRYDHALHALNVSFMFGIN